MDDRSTLTIYLATYDQLKKMALRQKQLNASINTTGTAKVPEQTPPLPPPSKRIMFIKKLISRRVLIKKKVKKVRNQLTPSLKLKYKEVLQYFTY